MQQTTTTDSPGPPVSADAAIRRYRIRRLKRRVDRSERRLRDLEAQACAEWAFLVMLRAYIAGLEADAADRGWELA